MDDPYRYKVHIFLKKIVIAFCFMEVASSFSTRADTFIVMLPISPLSVNIEKLTAILLT